MLKSPQAAGPGQRRIELGRITGPFGVRGWIKVHSYTEPPEQILAYPVWRASRPDGATRELRPAQGRRHGRGLAVRLTGIDGREQAQALSGQDLWIERRELPVLPKGEYYQADLVGLSVENLDGRRLGRVDHFLDTPGNTIMVVIGEREHWLPLVRPHLRRVDLEGGRITVDWDPDF